MKVALVYDRVNKYGGAERVLEALHSIWPDAPIYTSVYDPEGAPWADGYDVRPSFLNRLPLARRNHELFAWLTPVAFETFSFSGYDAVVSVTSAEAKYIITTPDTLHVCYCLTPTRYLWSGYNEYLARPGLGYLGSIARPVFRLTADRLRRWDLIGSARPDRYIAISEVVAERIRTYYHRDADAVIPPPVNLAMFDGGDPALSDGLPRIPDGYYLTVGRLVGYKRIDLVVRAFNELGLPLVVIGSGRDERVLKRLAKGNIVFISGHLTENDLVYYYKHCRAFVFAGAEDFGLVAAEAQAAGKPVVAYARSGMGEIVREGQTGILFNRQTVQDLKEAVVRSTQREFGPAACRSSAARFSLTRFRTRFRGFIETAVHERGRPVTNDTI